MLGILPGTMVGGKIGSVLNMKPEGAAGSSAQTPDLFSLALNVELKGQVVQVEVGASTLVSDVYEKAVALLGGEKARKEASDRALLYKETSIFLPPARRIDSFLWNTEPGEYIELTLKKKEKKDLPIVILIDGKTEMIEVNPNTTVQGVIQLLPRRTLEDEFNTIYCKKGKLDWAAKIVTVIKKDEALECKLDPELKGQGGFKDKKKARKSMAPMKKPITPSSSASSISSAGAGAKDKEKDKKNLERLLVNRPSEADLKRKNIIVDFKTDAKTSAPAAVDPNSALPLQLKLFFQLGSFLKKQLDLVGLFRVSGDVEEVKSFYGSLWGPKIDWSGTQKDPHIVSSCLKLYLRKQADPLIPFANYNEFLSAQKLEDDDAQLEAIKIALSKLPEPNASILHYLMHLLTLVAEHEPANKMNPINIGIVFGPTIMWDPKPNVMDYSSTGYQSNLVTNMIQHYDSLWTTQPPSDASVSDDSAVSASNNSNNASNNGISDSSAASSPASSLDTSSLLPTLEHSHSESSIGRSHSPSRPQPYRPQPPGAGLGASVGSGAASGAPLPNPAAGGPPKRMLPKMPPSLPPGSPSQGNAPGNSPPMHAHVAHGNGNGAGFGMAPSSSAEQVGTTSGPPSRSTSFRKSLPPNSQPPVAPVNGLTPLPETGELHHAQSTPLQHHFHERAHSSTAGLGAGRPTPPISANSSPTQRRMSSPSATKYDALIQSIEEELRDNIVLGACPSATSAATNMDQLKAFLNNMTHVELVRHTAAIIAAAGGRPSS